VPRRGTSERLEAHAEQLGELARAAVPMLTLREVVDTVEYGQLIDSTVWRKG
jgi:hypothetical protein